LTEVQRSGDEAEPEPASPASVSARGPADRSPAEELDALIGGLRQEAARRRAAPDFPIDDEARLGAVMDREGPVGPRTDLRAVAADLEAAARRLGAGPAVEPPGRLRGRRRAATDDAERFGRWAADVAGIADLAASLARSASSRLEAMERRLERIEGPSGDAPSGPEETGSAREAPGSLLRWEGRVAAAARLAAETALPRTGSAETALIAGAGAGRWLERVRPSLPGAYALDTGAPAFSDEDRIRSGSLFEHLHTVGDRALALAVVVGPLPATELPRLGLWAAELARVAHLVVVVSEAPWAWRRRLGDAAADLAGDRPVSAETWMDILHGAGMSAGARFAPGGADYCLAAGRSAVGS
jgi:hypothetical protein